MAIGILGPLNQIINKTAAEFIDKKISSGISDVLTTLVKTTFEVVDETLKKVQDLTKEEPPPATPPAP